MKEANKEFKKIIEQDLVSSEQIEELFKDWDDIDLFALMVTIYSHLEKNVGISNRMLKRTIKKIRKECIKQFK